MIEKNTLIELQQYVEKHFKIILSEAHAAPKYSKRCHSEELQPYELEAFIKNNRKPTFSQVLFAFIDKKDSIDSEIYKKAGIDRRHFSKIRSIPDYRPGKNTVIALALALELNKREMDKLLSSAGYSLSDSDTFDLVIQFCIEKNIYDLQNVNEALDHFSLKPLT